MRSLLRSLGVSIILFSAFVVNGQNNKYTRKNAKAPTYTYCEGKCYSRSIIVDGDIVYTANSNGALYKYNLKDGSRLNLMQGRKFQEMRDLHLVNNQLIGMQSGTDGLLIKSTKDHFLDYIIQSQNKWIGVFLDGMDFKGNLGFMMGDPIKGYFSLYYSEDGGENWLPCEGKLEAQKDEAGFAASGTNVQILNDSTFTFVSGGSTSKFYKSTDKGKTWTSSVIPYFQGEGSGAFSMCFINEKEGVVVGGDYANPTLNLNNSYYTNDGGEFWTNSSEQVNGYRSCVVESNGVYYACGTTGIDYSKDGGDKWEPFALGNYFAMTVANEQLYVTTTNGSFQIFELIK